MPESEPQTDPEGPTLRASRCGMADVSDWWYEEDIATFLDSLMLPGRAPSALPQAGDARAWVNALPDPRLFRFPPNTQWYYEGTAGRMLSELIGWDIKGRWDAHEEAMRSYWKVPDELANIYGPNAADAINVLGEAPAHDSFLNLVTDYQGGQHSAPASYNE